MLLQHFSLPEMPGCAVFSGKLTHRLPLIIARQPKKVARK